MVLDFLLLVLGLALLVGGGEMLVRGASSLATAVGVPRLIIGLTLVAFGTSTPELAVNVIAAWMGRGGVSFGNITGSNMANIGLILGLSALVRPIRVDAGAVRREIPMMLLATGVTVALGIDRLWGAPADVYHRGDGLVLLLLLAVFLYYNAVDLMRSRAEERLLREMNGALPPRAGRGPARDILLSLAGVAALGAGGRLAVVGAVGLARAAGVPETIIGLTLIAVGTSLPELATSLVAVWRDQPDIAIGNVVGSNIFNLLCVLAVSALIRPVPVPAGGRGDLAAVSLLSLLLFPIAASDKRRIVRAEGALLLAIYLAYIGWRALG
ncbi:MAG: sodium:calcium antiporter [Acidobacteria bacterium]|nr:MAG: sodium:calcium antiporter [Acidobacteriota bacterium]